MRYQVLATDYDGTIAHHGRVDGATVTALEKLLGSGRRLVLVTGRELPELLQIFPRIDLFEWVVAENGALLYRPATKEERALTEQPSGDFLRELTRREVSPVSVGRVIVATWEPHEKTVLAAIHDLGLDLQVIFNKGAVMVLPAGVNKASGLSAALKEMGLSPHNVVAVGDAENDHAFMRLCECAAAVANALPTVKGTADLVTAKDHGAGVAELIEEIVESDLERHAERLTRHGLPLGTAADGDDAILLPSYGPNVLVTGPSGSGKSTVATSLLEVLAEGKYQYCVIDPEGDYETFEGCVVVGGPKRAPTVEETLRLLENPEQSVVVTMTGMAIADRPPFFLELLPQLLAMRARTGRPHWLFLDEVHHLLPAAWQPSAGMLPEDLHSTVQITVHPELLAPVAAARVDTLIAVGDESGATLRAFAWAVGDEAPEGEHQLDAGEVLLWRRGKGEPVKVRARQCRSERRRHRRKYAEGNLPPERCFFFRGPHNKLNLRAQNLIMYLQMAEGVDDATWNHHLRNGDYATWFRDCIKDEALAAEAERIARLPKAKAAETRKLIKAAVERDYTLPASPPIPVPGAS